MFTGIIKELGTIKEIKGASLFIEVSSKLGQSIEPGSSLAVNGCCLTAEEITANIVKVTLMPETFKRTMFNSIKSGDTVNLETSVDTKTLFDGHIVSGHVDAIGTIESIQPAGNSYIFVFKAPKELMRYIIEKGSITINGISLTVISASDNSFSVGIIPFTWKHTMLHQTHVGDQVNIEVDMLAKYIEKLIQPLK
jgi:riboflavin synthase